MKAETIISTVIAAMAVGLAIFQYLERHRIQLFIDLQGDKTAVAAAAIRVRSGKLPGRKSQRRKRRRHNLLQALVLAAVFESSGRSRALIYAALAKVTELGSHASELREIVDDISAIISRNSPYTDLSRAIRRIYALRAALSLDGDVRVRVDITQLPRAISSQVRTPDKRLTHVAHTWTSLAKALQSERRLVLVKSSSNRGTYAILALDFHRVAREQDGERFAPSPTGTLVIKGKYGNEQKLNAFTVSKCTQELANRLANLVITHPQYARAEWIAAVPGTYHEFSVLLGRQIAEKTGKALIVIAAAPQSAKPSPRKFSMAGQTITKGAVCILVDDVYRSGDTWNVAANILMEEGASEVLGLTATCTVSPVALDCAADCSSDQRDLL